MNRDVITTIIGLVLVGIVVVATFLYGNQQRQTQLRNNQTAQKQSQEQKAKPGSSTSTSKSNSQTSSSGQVATNSTSPQQPGVPAPTSNPSTLQGGKPTGSASQPAQSKAQATAPQVPATGAGLTETPRTGAADALLPTLAATAMVLLFGLHRRSRLAVLTASRSR